MSRTSVRFSVALRLSFSGILISSFWLVGCAVTAAAESSPSATGNASARFLVVKSIDDLRTLAAELAKQPHRPEPPLIPELADLNYDRYREIEFRHDHAVWDDGEHPFWLEFFHRGFVQRDRIDVFLISPSALRSGAESKSTADPDPAAVEQVHYSPEQFRFGGETAGLKLPESVGFAGLKIAGRFLPGGDPQELLTFIGSSYFRSRTGETVYGSSARGLAVDAGMNRDEEFPDFRAFWVIEPESDDKELTILALLDSVSVTGAYEFRFCPSQTVSRLRVDATLCFRSVPGKLAIAPLTSMWIWGDGLAGPVKDARPAVHDADGLLIHADDRWQWRAFARSPYPSVTAVSVAKLSGFGLLQRDRNFFHYDDYNALYDRRPSVWVQPRQVEATQSWGSGKIELLEIPGAHEGVDNIGAYFVPDVIVDLNKPMRLRYDIAFFGPESRMGDRVDPRNQDGLPLATVRSFDLDREAAADQIAMTVNFQIKPGVAVVEVEAREAVVIEADIQTVRGEVAVSKIERTPMGYQVELGVMPTEAAPVEIELTLKDERGTPVTETFRYLCPHEQPTFVYPAVYTRQE